MCGDAVTTLVYTISELINLPGLVAVGVTTSIHAQPDTLNGKQSGADPRCACFADLDSDRTVKIAKSGKILSFLYYSEFVI